MCVFVFVLMILARAPNFINRGGGAIKGSPPVVRGRPRQQKNAHFSNELLKESMALWATDFFRPESPQASVRPALRPRAMT